MRQQRNWVMSPREKSPPICREVVRDHTRSRETQAAKFRLDLEAPNTVLEKEFINEHTWMCMRNIQLLVEPWQQAAYGTCMGLISPPGMWMKVSSGRMSSSSLRIHSSGFLMVKFTKTRAIGWAPVTTGFSSCTMMTSAHWWTSIVELPILVVIWQRQAQYGYDPRRQLYKLVPSSLDSSLDSLVATLIMEDGNFGRLCISLLVTYLTRGSRHPLQHLWDVTFFYGKSYAMSLFAKLFILVFCENFW